MDSYIDRYIDRGIEWHILIILLPIEIILSAMCTEQSGGLYRV